MYIRVLHGPGGPRAGPGRAGPGFRHGKNGPGQAAGITGRAGRAGLAGRPDCKRSGAGPTTELTKTGRAGPSLVTEGPGRA
jgi:hypothetical protein